jgi:ATP-binding cassette subfamily C protein CydC
LSVTSTFSWIFPAAGVEALAVVRTAARYGERLTTHGATLQVLARLRAQVFASATRMAPRQLRRFHSGDLLDRVQADIDSLDRAILAVAVPTVVAAIIGASGLAVPALIRPAFALVTGLALAAAVAGDLVAGRRGRRAGGNLARARAAARARLVEVLDGRAEIAAYDAGPRGLGPRRRQAPRARGWHGRQSSALDRQARPARWRAYLADRCLGGRQVDAASGTGGRPATDGRHGPDRRDTPAQARI